MARFKQSERDEALSEARSKLLSAATDEFAREGYLGANINRISLAAGFAKGTIYNYFPSKRALLLELVDEIAAAHLAFVSDQVFNETDARNRLVRFFESGFDFVSQHPAQAQVMINALYGPDRELKLHMYQAYQPMFQLLSEDVIDLGISQGQFREVDTEATSTLLMTIYLGTGSQVGERGEVLMSPAEVSDFVLRALLEAQHPDGG